MRTLTLTLAFSLAAASPAPPARAAADESSPKKVERAVPAHPASLEGYVVKVEKDRVYLDQGSETGVRVGHRFAVFAEGEELRHPVTGASLGPIVRELASGEIVEVQDKYCVGKLVKGEGASPGQKARVFAGEAPAAPAAPAQGARTSGPKPVYRSPLLDIVASDVAVGDVNGDGGYEAVLTGKNRILAFPLRMEGEKWAPVCELKRSRTGDRILSVEASDVDGNGRAEIFVTLHNKLFNRVESSILECEKGSFKEKSAIPWMVRSYKTPDGSWALAMQQLESRQNFPLSNIYSMEYRNGKYARARKRIKHKRLDWLYGFGLAEADGSRVMVGYSRANRLRLQFKRRSWSSKEKFGETAQRVRFNERTFEFHPRIVLETGAKGLKGVYTLRNVPRFFALARTFAAFNRAELHHLSFTGTSLTPVWQADIGGYAAGLAELPAHKGAPERLMVAVVGGEDKTSLWIFNK